MTSINWAEVPIRGYRDGDTLIVRGESGTFHRVLVAPVEGEERPGLQACPLPDQSATAYAPDEDITIDLPEAGYAEKSTDIISTSCTPKAYVLFSQEAIDQSFTFEVANTSGKGSSIMLEITAGSEGVRTAELLEPYKVLSLTAQPFDLLRIYPEIDGKTAKAKVKTLETQATE